MATGILLFLLYDVLRPRGRAGGGGARRGRRRGRFVARVHVARRAVRARRRRRAAEPRLLRRLDRRPAPQEDARPGRCVGGRVRGAPPSRSDVRSLARAHDRDRHRPPQLLRGPRDRPVGGRRRGGARADARDRLCPPQRDRGLRHRRAALRRRRAADLALPAPARSHRRRPDVPRHAHRPGVDERGALGRVPRARRRLDPLRHHRARQRQPPARAQGARVLGAARAASSSGSPRTSCSRPSAARHKVGRCRTHRSTRSSRPVRSRGRSRTRSRRAWARERWSRSRSAARGSAGSSWGRRPLRPRASGPVPVTGVVDEVPTALVDLALWMAEYYGSTPARALALVAPPRRARRGERRTAGRVVRADRRGGPRSR